MLLSTVLLTSVYFKTNLVDKILYVENKLDHLQRKRVKSDCFIFLYIFLYV